MAEDASLLDMLQEDSARGPTPDKLETISHYCHEARDIQMEIDALELELKEKKAKLLDLQAKKIPEIMDEVGLKTTATSDDWIVTVKSELKGTLPKDPINRQRALEEVKKLDGEEIIKNEITISLGKGEEHVASRILQELARLEVPQDYIETKKGIHPQTFLKFLREKIASGNIIEFEKLGVYEMRQAEIKPPQMKKVKSK